MNRIVFLFISTALCLVIISGCTSLKLKSPSPDNRVILSLEAQKDCRVVNTTSQWFLLYGLIPVNRPDPADLFLNNILKKSAFGEGENDPGDGKKYDGTFYIEARTAPLDVMVTLLGGWAITLTRKTIQVKVCKEDMLVTTGASFAKRKAALERSYVEGKQKEINAALRKHSPERGRGYADRLIVITKSGASYLGEIIEFSDTRIVLLARVDLTPKDEKNEKNDGEKSDDSKVEPTPEPKTKTVDQIILRNREIIEGKIITQDARSVLIRVDPGGKTEAVSKDRIQQIKYSVAAGSQEKQSEQKFVVKRLVIERKNVSQIVLRPGG